MSEPKGNKNLVWINTPFSLTKLDKQYTLLQQNILMVASTHLQKYVEEYFTEKRVLGDARSDYLFEIFRYQRSFIIIRICVIR